MQTTWQVQEAKSRFSELISLSLAQGPQTITRHGRAVAQIVAIKSAATPPDADKAASPSTGSDDVGNRFSLHLLSAPSVDAALEPLPRRNRKQAPTLGG